ARRLDAQRLLRTHGDDRGVTRLDEVGFLLGNLPACRVDLRVDGFDGAGDLCGVGVEDWCVARGDHRRVLHHDDLCLEGFGDRRRVLGGTGDIAPADVVLADATDVEPDVVARPGFGDFLVVHFDAL